LNFKQYCSSTWKSFSHRQNVKIKTNSRSISLDILEAAACLGTMASAMGPTPGSPDGAMSNYDNYDRWRDEDGKGDDDDDDDDDE